MSWNNLVPVVPYFCPFYNYSTALQPQMPYIQLLYRTPIVEGFQIKQQEQDRKKHESKQKQNKKEANCRAALNQSELSPFRQKLMKKREKEDKFQKKKQKKDRNMPSNIFKIFLSNLYSHPTTNYFQFLLKSQHIKIDLEIFIHKIQSRLNLAQTYIRPSTVQQLCVEGILSKEESLLFRLLVKRFLLVDLPMQVAPIKKYRRQKKKDFMKIGRRLFVQLKQQAFS